MVTCTNLRSTFNSPGTVVTELHTTINDLNRRKGVENLQLTIGLKSSEIAYAITYAINKPDTVAVSEIIVRPTKQVD
ncbi:hypothetical protein AB1K18_09580 [Peribacillus simplex]|uniref:hypothetical protein n=1 Tax=Peribacillus simplex TaxID=1478 RepID=UPI003B8E665D